MGTFELVNLLGSGLLAFIGTMWANAADSLQREREWRIRQNEANETATANARSFGGHHAGYYWVRMVIALIAITFLFGAVLLPAVRPEMQVIIGIYQPVESIWPWDNPADAIHWVKVGAAEPATVLTILPIHSNIALTIVGFFFGNQIGRRGR